MGTRSSIKFIQQFDKNNSKILANIYQQFDGYIEGGVGEELANWLLTKKLINGIGPGTDTQEFANGAGCLAAQFVKEFKKGPGNLYLVPADDNEEYNYRVIIPNYNDKLDFLDPNKQWVNADDVVTIEVIIGRNNNKPIFVGKPSELLKFKETDENDDD